jgi:hypothetical protein
MDTGNWQEKINLDDLYIRSRELYINRLKTYQKILGRAHKKIKITSRQKHNDFFCFYVVPEFLVGVPTYDIITCITYLIEELTTNGFEVKYTHPNLLFISWKHYIPAFQRLEIKKKYGIKIDGFGNLVKEKVKEAENKKLISATSTTLAAKKNFKAISTYKPTGNLIYGKDLIKRITTKTT